MTPQDFLNYSLGIGFLVLVGSISWVCYHVVQTLKEIQQILEDTEDVTHDITLLKNTLKMGATRLFGKTLGR